MNRSVCALGLLLLVACREPSQLPPPPVGPGSGTPPQGGQAEGTSSTVLSDTLTTSFIPTTSLTGETTGTAQTGQTEETAFTATFGFVTEQTFGPVTEGETIAGTGAATTAASAP